MHEDINPPEELTPAQVAKLRPLADWPTDLPRMFLLAWHDGERWLGMYGQRDEAGVFWADAVLHRTNVLAGVPTHFVDDIGLPEKGDAA